jgi:hypothetical protein
MAGGQPKSMFGVQGPLTVKVPGVNAPNTAQQPMVGPAAPIPPQPEIPLGQPPAGQVGYSAPTGNPREDVAIAASMLQRNADGSLVDPTESQMAALQNTFRLPDGRVVDAATANQLMQATQRPGGGGGYYQKHFKSATEDYLKSDAHATNINQMADQRKAQYDSTLRAGQAGQEQAYQDLAAADAYQGVVRGQEQVQMQAQMEADKRYGQYEKDLHAAQRDYDVELGGGSSARKATTAASMLFGGIAAGLAQAYGAAAQIKSGGTYRNTADVTQYMNGLIERDMLNTDRRVAGAKQKMTGVQQMYQDFRSKFKDDTVAREATKAVAKDIFATQVEKNAQQFKGTQVWENAQQQAAEIRRSAVQDRENANLLMRQVIDQNTHLLQAPVTGPTAGVQLQSSMDALLQQIEARGKLRAALAPYGSGSGGEGLTEGGKGRVQKATEESAGYATAGAMAEELAGPNSPIDKTDYLLRDMEEGGPLGTVLKHPYAWARGLDVDSAKTVAYREQAALQPLRIAITGAGAGQTELETLQKLISSSGTNETKKARYREAVAFTARFIAQKAPPDPAERRAYIDNLRRNGTPESIIHAVETGRVPDQEVVKTNEKKLFGQ